MKLTVRNSSEGWLNVYSAVCFYFASKPSIIRQRYWNCHLQKRHTSTRKGHTKLERQKEEGRGVGWGWGWGVHRDRQKEKSTLLVFLSFPLCTHETQIDWPAQGGQTADQVAHTTACCWCTLELSAAELLPPLPFYCQVLKDQQSQSIFFSTVFFIFFSFQ